MHLTRWRIVASLLGVLAAPVLARAPRSEPDEDGHAPLPRQGTLAVHLDAALMQTGVGGKHTLLAWGWVQPLARVPIRHGLLLASEDGGKTWRERLPPQPDVEVLAVVPAGNHWRAVLGGTREGPGALWLYDGRDFTHPFRKVAEIPRPGNLDQLTHASFSTEQTGCVFLTSDADDTTHSLATTDGGRHWSPAQVPCPEPSLQADTFQEAAPRQRLEWRGGGTLQLPLQWQRSGERWTPIAPRSGH